MQECYTDEVTKQPNCIPAFLVGNYTAHMDLIVEELFEIINESRKD
jgi:hypothetical protein